MNCGLNLYLFFTTKIMLFSGFSKFPGNFFSLFLSPGNSWVVVVSLEFQLLLSYDLIEIRIRIIRQMIPIANPMMRGEKTHHQEMLMTPRSLRVRRIMKIIPQRPMPPPELLLLLIVYIN